MTFCIVFIFESDLPTIHKLNVAMWMHVCMSKPLDFTPKPQQQEDNIWTGQEEEEEALWEEKKRKMD